MRASGRKALELPSEPVIKRMHNAISHLLSQVPYESEEPDPVRIPKRPAAKDYERPPVDEQRFVPDHAASLLEP